MEPAMEWPFRLQGLVPAVAQPPHMPTSLLSCSTSLPFSSSLTMLPSLLGLFVFYYWKVGALGLWAQPLQACLKRVARVGSTVPTCVTYPISEVGI